MGKACDRAGIADATFHDLRGTTITELATAGCLAAGIAPLMGHAPKDSQTLLDVHSLRGRLELADTAMATLEDKRGGPQTVDPGEKPEQGRRRQAVRPPPGRRSESQARLLATPKRIQPAQITL